MDDAADRRGKSALHQEFGEGTAVLVGLALLNASYGLVFAGLKNDCTMCSTIAIRAHRELIDCIGANGMVGGQSIDLTLAKQEASDANHFESLRNLKTSALMRMALRLGAILSGANERQLSVLSEFAELLGDAYQTSDDLLDIQEDLQIKQTTERCPTFALGQGLDKAKTRVNSLVSQAKNILNQEFGPELQSTKLLCSMADYIAERKA
jgi:geranylgeranyl pyrophosphate synthase